MQQVSDASLLFAAARSRDGEAIGALIGRYGELLYTVAMRIVSVPDRAEKIARDCALDIARRPWKVRGEPAVAIHEMITRRAAEISPLNGAHLQRDPAEEPHWEEICHALDLSLLRLSKRHRHIIIQHYFQRHGQDDLAAMLQVTQPVVAQRLRKALEALRGKLLTAGAGCSLGQLMILLARHGASDAPAGWVADVAADASHNLAANPSGRRNGWLGIVAVWAVIGGLIIAVAASYSATRDTAEATTTQRSN